MTWLGNPDSLHIRYRKETIECGLSVCQYDFCPLFAKLLKKREIFSNDTKQKWLLNSGNEPKTAGQWIRGGLLAMTESKYMRLIFNNSCCLVLTDEFKIRLEV
jgi:hypothetical protein